MGVTVVVPAFNEAPSITKVVRDVTAAMVGLEVQHEVLVVDDGSCDGTGEGALSAGARVIANPTNLGYGASLKRGIAAATYPWILIVDADETYPADRIGELVRHAGPFDMVVGARTGPAYRGGVLLHPARAAFKWLAQFVTGVSIPDVNSGFRIFRKEMVEAYFPVLSTGFSFTTSLTVAMLSDGYLVKYVPVPYRRRSGRSKVRLVRDTLRAGQILTETIVRSNPIKLFLLGAMIHAVVGLGLLAGYLFSQNVVVGMGSVAALFLSALTATLGLALRGIQLGLRR